MLLRPPAEQGCNIQGSLLLLHLALAILLLHLDLLLTQQVLGPKIVIQVSIRSEGNLDDVLVFLLPGFQAIVSLLAKNFHLVETVPVLVLHKPEHASTSGVPSACPVHLKTALWWRLQSCPTW